MDEIIESYRAAFVEYGAAYDEMTKLEAELDAARERLSKAMEVRDTAKTALLKGAAGFCDG